MSATPSRIPESSRPLHPSPSRLPEASRVRVVGALNAVLADALDLHAAAKVAHWNVKGPLFASLHALFEELATGLASHGDDVAERAVTLGGVALGTVRHVARTSRVPDYPQETTRDLDHVRLLAERLEVFLEGVRAARGAAEEEGDGDTVDLLTQVASELEKHGWMLRATIG